MTNILLLFYRDRACQQKMKTCGAVHTCAFTGANGTIKQQHFSASRSPVLYKRCTKRCLCKQEAPFYSCQQESKFGHLLF